MDWFMLWLDGLTFAGFSIIHLFFVGSLVGKRPKYWHTVGYFFLLCILQAFCVTFQIEGILSIMIELFLLYGVSCFWLGNRGAVCGISSILAIYVCQLSFGMINSLEILLIPPDFRGWKLYCVLSLATVTAFGLCFGFCRLVLKYLSFKEETPHLRLLLLSGLFFFSAELYIVQTAYPYISGDGGIGEQFLLFLLQAMGLAAFICTLYAYQRVLYGLKAQAALDSLTQEVKAQKRYVGEAQKRYDKTKAFRHDIKNHFSVLHGLLTANRVEEAKDYLKKMETAAVELSFPCQTKNPVVDILLGEKLELAKAWGIGWETFVLLPQNSGIDDFDWCVIFANGLDNAIEASKKVNGERWIKMKGERQGDFYRLEFKNSCVPGPMPPMGTGLSNIKSVAEKYHGAILTEKEEHVFCLNVLLKGESL